MSNEPKRSFSPFLKARHYLSFLRIILGFPLTPVNETFDSFEFKPFRELIRYLIYIVIYGSACATNGVIYSSKRENANPALMFNERLKDFGFTGLDVAVLMFLPWLNIVTNTIYFISFKGITSKINKIVCLIIELEKNLFKLLGGDVFDSLEDKTMKKGLKFYWNLLYISLAPLLATILITISFATIAFTDDTIDFSTLEKVFFCFGLGFFASSYIYPPSAMSADFIVYFLLVEAKEMCEKYCTAMVLSGHPDSLQNNPQKSRHKATFSRISKKPTANVLMRSNKVIDVESSKTDITNNSNKDSLNDIDYEKDIIEIGFNLIKVVKIMDKAFAPMIANTYFTCMLVATGELYLASSVFFYKGKFEVSLLSAAGLSIAWLAIFRASQITKHGHFLTKLMKKCSYHLDRFSFKESNDLNSGVVELLREEFKSNCDTPIAPYSAFTLSFSSLLGFFGSIVTYIIVLLQFRTS